MDIGKYGWKENNKCIIGGKYIMACEICMKIGNHDPKCPNYHIPKAKHYCSACGQGIYNGEEYIRNQNDEYRHYDCFRGLMDLLKWLGYKIEIMEEEN